MTVAKLRLEPVHRKDGNLKTEVAWTLDPDRNIDSSRLYYHCSG